MTCSPDHGGPLPAGFGAHRFELGASSCRCGFYLRSEVLAGEAATGHRFLDRQVVMDARDRDARLAPASVVLVDVEPRAKGQQMGLAL